uniref:Uncharacterized protein n=1 Tax=Lactuca sativa TaxID=4236 RepID=A0A9R1UMH5_LACSA|nr:hypothetical protein LSAT_V11C800410370 [Lactuca sativa]
MEKYLYYVLCMCMGRKAMLCGSKDPGRKAKLCGSKDPGRKAMLCGPRGPGRMAYVRKVLTVTRDGNGSIVHTEERVEFWRILESEKYSIRMPNKWNFSFDYFYFAFVVLATL